MVVLLLDKGADVNALGGKYGSALQAASCLANKAVVYLLLENIQSKHQRIRRRKRQCSDCCVSSWTQSHREAALRPGF